MLTVTYGENCSPYLSLRTLKQLCLDEDEKFPEAVKIILNDKYADDFLSGADDEDGAKQLRDQLIEIMKKGGFELRKWVANVPALLEDLPECERLRPTWLQLDADGPVSELGVSWDPTTDNFRFAPPVIESTNITKRKVLAGIARLFDPCGWLSPIVLLAKQLMQDLWKAKLEWDEFLPFSMAFVGRTSRQISIRYPKSPYLDGRVVNHTIKLSCMHSRMLVDVLWLQYFTHEYYTKMDQLKSLFSLLRPS